MTTAQATRFTFDLDLARSRKVTRTLPEDELEQMLADARRAGFEEGMGKGRGNAEVKAAEALAKAAEALASNVASMVEATDAHQRDTLRGATELAASIGRKLAAHLIARHPAAELEALISECMGSLDHAPHLVVRCHPDLCDALQTAATERMRSSGFTGRLVVMGDPEIGMGDGRLEWVDGGLVRDINKISAEINQRINAYLAARGATQQQEAN